MRVWAKSGHFSKHQQIVAPEALRTLPLIGLFVEPREGDVVPGLIFGSVAPNCRFDATDPDFINWFLVSHNVFSPKELRVCERFPLTREWRKTPKPGRGRKAPTAPVTGRDDKSKVE